MLTYKSILDGAGTLIYISLAAAALYGVFLVVLLLRRISQKRFSNATTQEDFRGAVREHLERRDYEGLVGLCDSPGYWSKATPQLMLVALANTSLSPGKLRQLVAEKFERDILADIEYRTSWVATIVKSAPMLGLLGTVIGMISAFQDIAGMKQTGMDPSGLAESIGIALFTTAIGLAVAIPLVLAGAAIQVRIGKLQDSVQETMGEFLDLLETSLRGGEGA